MTDIDLEEIKNRVAATSEPLPDDARLNAYYYAFDKTNCGPIDAVLSAVAVAGKGAHNTIDWNNTDTYGYYKDRAGLPPNPESALDLIELTAKASAEKVSAAVEDVAALIAEVERLQAQIGVVRTLHEPIEALNTTVNRVQKVCLGCGQDNGNWQNWPCPTTRALEDPAATHAGYTSHGHPIAGLKQSGKPSSVMRCGGPSICARCALEASRATRSEAQRG